MRVISETTDWESSNLINARNAEGGVCRAWEKKTTLIRIASRENFLHSLWVHVLEEGLGKLLFLFPN